MKKTIFLAIISALSISVAHAASKNYEAINDVGCIDLETQQMRVGLMRIIMTTDSADIKNEAVASMVRISNAKGVCTPNIQGKFRIIQERNRIVQLDTPLGKLWVIK